MVGPMVDCVDLWSPLLPLWISDYLLEQLVLPRLQREARQIYVVVGERGGFRWGFFQLIVFTSVQHFVIIFNV